MLVQAEHCMVMQALATLCTASNSDEEEEEDGDADNDEGLAGDDDVDNDLISHLSDGVTAPDRGLPVDHEVLCRPLTCFVEVFVTHARLLPMMLTTRSHTCKPAMTACGHSSY